MKAIEIVEAIQNKKGTNVQAIWQRPAKTLKTFAGSIQKRTKTYVRSGISYSNLSDVKEAIAAGERGEVQSLPWGQWRTGFERYIIEHKGVEYVRLYPASFENLRANVEWLLNGQVVEYQDVEPYLLASEKLKRDEEKPLCFTLKAQDILTIAGE